VPRVISARRLALQGEREAWPVEEEEELLHEVIFVGGRGGPDCKMCCRNICQDVAEILD